jgi:hypothetical protein
MVMEGQGTYFLILILMSPVKNVRLSLFSHGLLMVMTVLRTVTEHCVRIPVMKTIQAREEETILLVEFQAVFLASLAVIVAEGLELMIMAEGLGLLIEE